MRVRIERGCRRTHTLSCVWGAGFSQAPRVLLVAIEDLLRDGRPDVFGNEKGIPLGLLRDESTILRAVRVGRACRRSSLPRRLAQTR